MTKPTQPRQTLLECLVMRLDRIRTSSSPLSLTAQKSSLQIAAKGERAADSRSYALCMAQVKRGRPP
jgi:hypothetical protein